MKVSNMKKISFGIILYSLFFILYSGNVTAATPTPSVKPQATISDSESQINKLKDRIASRVAELKLVERRGIIGTASEISDTQIIIIDVQGNNRFIDVDELTKFASPSAKEPFGISDLEKGNTLGILGLYNKQSRRMLARFINVLKLPTIIHGKVAETDPEEFTIKITASDNQSYIIDVENTTKTQSYTKESGLARSGFSKIKEGQRIMVSGLPEKNDKNRLLGERVIIFTETPPNPQIQTKN